MSEARQLTVEFSVNLARARQIASMRHDVDVRLRTRKTLGVAIDARGEAYLYLQLLGAGSYGRVYSAVRSTASLEPTHVVKEIDVTKKRAGPTAEADIEYTLNYVEHEYGITNIIRRRLGDAVCEQNFVCAIDRFYNRPRTTAYIVSTFVGTTTLAQYIGTVLRGAALRFDTALTTLGMYEAPLPDLLRVALDTDDPLALPARALWRELMALRLRCMALAVRFATAVAYLHDVDIFHQDLNPSNVIVTENRVLLIDFGLACVAPRDDDPLFDASEALRSGCPDEYDTTIDYLDPLARYQRADDTSHRDMFAKFDTYAAAKVLQTIFDPTLIDARGYRAYPTVRKSAFMPVGVLQLLVKMTGEFGYRPRNVDAVLLTLDEQRARREQFRTRPSMREVVFALVAEVEALDQSYTETERQFQLQ